MQCNICGHKKFLDMNNRTAIRCAKCGSLERTRVIKLMLDKHGLPRKGMKVLHLAPEGGLARNIRDIVGADSYDARDIDLARYEHVKVTYFDLVENAHTLPRNHFDLIIHSHVMEHLPCNVTAVLYHLHRALSETGVHVFSIPILNGYYEESLFPISDEERQRRFAQFDHVRRFGKEDLQRSVGMIFKIPDTYDLKLDYSKAELDAANIPVVARQDYTGHSVFMLRKNDLLLN